MVSCDLSPGNVRAESDIAINPLDPNNILGASHRQTMIQPSGYQRFVTPYVTFDGGESWQEVPVTLPSGWRGTTDPVVAWDNMGNGFLVALPYTALDKVIGIAVYQSSDGGRTWGAPNLIHQSDGGDPKDINLGDDKPWAEGDPSRSGNVYLAWDDNRKDGNQIASYLCFARTTDHGQSWKGIAINGVDQKAGYPLLDRDNKPIVDSFSPAVVVAPASGHIYIFWLGVDLNVWPHQRTTQIKYVKSTDGGASFSQPRVIASGILRLQDAFRLPGGNASFPGATFRIATIPTASAGSGPANEDVLAVAWADARDAVDGSPQSRIYYQYSTDGGMAWLASAGGNSLSSVLGAYDFHPQLACTPNGEIGYAFYRYTPGFDLIYQGQRIPFPGLMDVLLAVSTDGGSTFAAPVAVSDKSWDPAVDAPSAGGSGETFIGDYFGLGASQLGFFPLWTDTRTGMQEIFGSRLAVNPADIYIRDSVNDTGTAPSSWYSLVTPDLVVRQQRYPPPDVGATTDFVSQPVLADGKTEHFIYGRVTNNGPNPARNVRLAVTNAYYQGGPGVEFRYPYDWRPNDFGILTANQYPGVGRIFLGTSAPIALLPSGASAMFGPIPWPQNKIGGKATLLAEVLADNDDSAGGPNGCNIPADPGPCYYGCSYWGSNNITQLMPKIVGGGPLYNPPPPIHVPPTDVYEIPFVIGNLWSRARYVETIIDKGSVLASTPMTLRIEPIRLSGMIQNRLSRLREAAELQQAQVDVAGDLGPLLQAARCLGGFRGEKEWVLTQPRGSVGFPTLEGQLWQVTLGFSIPTAWRPGAKAVLHVFQRNDERVMCGKLQMQLINGRPEGLR
jgi:hypothetical protein